MKKSIIILVLLVIVGWIAWSFTHKDNSPVPAGENTVSGIDEQVENPTSLVKVNDKLSLYKNEELGFSVNYPTTWVIETASNGALFSVPYDMKSGAKENTLKKLQVDVNVLPGKCSFPQVATIDAKDTIKVADSTFNMIAISNSVQGLKYFNRMYSLTKGSICYFFNLSSITSNPESKSYPADKLAAINASNKDIISTADAAFTAMVKSFAYVIGPEGENEALHSSTTTPKK